MSEKDYDASLEDERPYFLPIFSHEPAGLSPTRGVIKQGPAIGWSLFVGAVSFFLTTLLVWGIVIIVDPSTMWDRAEMNAMVGAYVGACLHLVPVAVNTVMAALKPNPHLWSPWFDTETTNLIDMLHAYPFGLGIRLALPIVASLVAARWTYVQMLIPQYKAQHADGAQFIKGQAAVLDLRRRMTRPYGHDAAWNAAKPYVYSGRFPNAVRKYRKVRSMDTFLSIHPDIGAAIKRVFNAGAILSGAPGSGKSVILSRWMWEAIQRDYRSVIFDPKGEFCELFGRYPGIKILSPFDRRSMVWDVAADCASDTAMNAFASALIPKSEKNPFFDVAAQMLLVGIMKTLYAEKSLDWGFADLAMGVTLPLDEMFENLKKYAPAAKEQYDFALDAAAQNIAGGDQSQTVNNIRASLSVGARLVGQLARAWGKPKKKAVKFSAKAWVKDGYTGPRQVLLMGNPEDKDLTGAYVASILNTMFRTVLTDLTNDESRRLCFFMDEFPELPVRHIIVDRVMAVARGFGVCVFLAYQDHSQVVEALGENKADTMLNLAAVKVFCRMAAGSKYVQAVAESLGKSRITLTTTTQSVASGQSPTISTSSHTEARNLVSPVQLTSEETMGVREPHQRERWQNWKPTGMAIRAILTIGTHVYRLDWPMMDKVGIKAKYGAVKSVPAKWTLAIGSDTTAVPIVTPENEATTEQRTNEPVADVESPEPEEPITVPDGNNPSPAVTENEDGRKKRLAELRAKKAEAAEPTGKRPTGNIIAVVEEPQPPADEPSRHEPVVHARKTDGNGEADTEEDDPIASAAADLGLELGLHAAGLGGIAPLVELGKAVAEAASGGTAAKPTHDQDGKPIKTTAHVIVN
ncbi:type IV secretion system DNA-binding domain-containing protein [Burkholderia gladioli]|uniref:type IV secretion system DNA-binding domain-containing protein n=1 Tax=Burkholderia gladioli TaxID=28095 RepID=UPI001641515C|nr:type IV secretion system DNA-binding domain-containing protein [Burkholderia gladioli]